MQSQVGVSPMWCHNHRCSSCWCNHRCGPHLCSVLDNATTDEDITNTIIDAVYHKLILYVEILLLMHSSSLMQSAPWMMVTEVAVITDANFLTNAVISKAIIYIYPDWGYCDNLSDAVCNVHFSDSYCDDEVTDAVFTDTGIINYVIITA